MLYIKINENNKQAKSLIQYIKTLSFVEVIDIENEEKITKEQFLKDIKKSFKEVKANKTKHLKDVLKVK